MDSHEATRAVFTRVQNIDPVNASKIIGYILLQEQAEKEMIRLAFGPESHIISVISKAKTELGFSPNTSSATNSSPPPQNFSTISNPISISIPNPLPLGIPSPRLAAHNGFNPSSPSSPSVWSSSGSGNQHISSPDVNNSSLSYAAVLNGNHHHHSSLNSPRLEEQNPDLFDQSIDLAMSPGFENGAHIHRRSCSVNDIFFVTDDSNSGFGFKPCHYFTRGFCKNGTTCNFAHGDEGFIDSSNNNNNNNNNNPVVGSPCKFDTFEQYQEIMRSKAAQQRLAASQLMAGVNLPYNKLNFYQREAQRSAAAAAALMIGEEYNKFNRFRMGRNDVNEMGFGDSAPGARQIYLTFPADSTFKEEDVSNYFSIYGPVQDVRIPYQQKRMFGFVTFVYSETVKIILAKGNPHFVCDSRVLVKPYKEKGKLADKKQHQQQFDRSEFLSCSSPTGLDYKEPFEMHVGPRMLLNNREMLRKKLEQEAAWQQALEYQRRRLMSMQLLDMKNHHSFQSNNASMGSPSHMSLNQNIHQFNNVFPENASEVFAENQGSPTRSYTEELPVEANASSDDGSNGNKEDNNPGIKVSDLLESLEHSLPDGLLTSPTKSAAEDRAIFAAKPFEVENGVTISAPTTTNNDMVSRFANIPSLSGNDGAFGM